MVHCPVVLFSVSDGCEVCLGQAVLNLLLFSVVCLFLCELVDDELTRKMALYVYHKYWTSSTHLFP